MDKIDWKSRFRNKYFLVSLISAFILLSQQLGIHLPSNISEIINTILVILTLFGIIIDPSTQGIADNKQIGGNE